MADERRRADAEALVELLSAATGLAPALWGSSISGFGSCHHRYESGREGDTVAVGLAARKDALVLYLTGEPTDYADLLRAVCARRSHASRPGSSWRTSACHSAAANARRKT